jgi:hypothetical protein
MVKPPHGILSEVLLKVNDISWNECVKASDEKMWQACSTSYRYLSYRGFQTYKKNMLPVPSYEGDM